jgi:antitoxin (DNA-binding transcriptional repressor) of toxin-antitoxin stability system
MAMAAVEISVTEAARGFSDCVNRVAYRGETFRLRRGGRTVAELRPAATGLRLGDLPALLAAAPRLGAEEAKAFAREVDRARGALNRRGLGDPWAS